MAVTKIRLSRGGSKKRPYYYVVVAPATAPRDGRYIERIGSYNPMLPKDHEHRIRLDEERCKYWLGVGAQPTDRVARFLEKAGLKDASKRNNPQKGLPGKKRQEREAEEAEGKRQAEEEAAAAAADAAEAAEGGAEATAS